MKVFWFAYDKDFGANVEVYSLLAFVNVIPNDYGVCVFKNKTIYQ